jgi:ribosomal protein S27AE
MNGEELLDSLPNGLIIVKDLSLDKSLKPGNPYCRYDTDKQSRKYCSEDLWESAEERFVIPDDSKIPRPHIVCGSCGQDSYITEEDDRDEPVCGRCGKPIFECPADGCEEIVHGEPDECPACGAVYKWE